MPTKKRATASAADTGSRTVETRPPPSVIDPADSSPGCVVFFAEPGDGPLMGSDAYSGRRSRRKNANHEKHHEKGKREMTSPVTFINVIDVDPSKQQEVISILNEGTERVISKRPGFISVTLLASDDKSRIVNIARWRSADDVRATQADPAAAEYARRTAAIATPGTGIYTVVSEFDD
jgi:antibiotic biosynthesis monooxygenase